MKAPITNLSAQANSSLANKTGSWRTVKPVINLNTCVGCSLCAKLCPEGCIEMKKQIKTEKIKAKINYDYCKGCGLCAHECPVKAIKMENDF
ncbi:4Fe-4S binding protein [Candidatus Falkowbacteria bacterium]|jgi:2-oxoacid:acceptor oxidoreductase delta subunit (pyruvate/2-ketoisovalerate family)|nr:4Fe-4S binding protein [Candidatus Falkowbacteria bacterium]